MLHEYVTHFEAHNALTSAAATRLTTTIAHSVPPLAPHEKRIARYLEHELERLQEGLQEDTDLDLPQCDDDYFLPAMPDLSAPTADPEDSLQLEDDEAVEDSVTDQLSSRLSDLSVQDSTVDGSLPLYTAVFATGDIDEPDPFYNPQPFNMHDDINTLSTHLVCIYAIVAWLHLNFHLPRVACNAVLWAFALVISAIAPSAAIPFVTLKSANHSLGLDSLPITILVVCPGCKEVYRSSNGACATCTKCSATLFKDSATARGTFRKSPVPIIKYPTMSIASQLQAMLVVPGLEDLLDGWRQQAREEGVYRDIFDGAVVHGLLGPDGKRFFANDGPHHSRGPNGELRIGVTWGVDW